MDISPTASVEKADKRPSKGDLKEKQLKRVYRFFAKYSWGAITIPAILPPPVPISPFLIAARAMKVGRKRFLAALTLGRAIRYFTVAYLASRFGRQIVGWIGHYYKAVLTTFIAFCLAGDIAGLVYWRTKKYRGQKRQHQKERSISKNLRPNPVSSAAEWLQP